MRATILLLACASVLFVSTRTTAQDPAPPPSSRIVTIEIVIAEFSTGGRAGPAVDLSQEEDIAGKLRQLEEQNAITSLTRATLSSLDQIKATVQIGHRVPLRTGRIAMNRRGDAGPAFQITSEIQQVGTIVSATPRVLDDGRVMAELQIEKSEVTQPPATLQEDSDPEAAVPSQRISTLSVLTTVQIPIGKFAVISSLTTTDEQESAQSVVIASARLGE